jgi:hypothetical protein
MTTRYVGPGGSDANSGLTWALRKLTLNGVEDTPVADTDIVYVGPGVYRESLAVDVSGTTGITYIGDVTGEHTDGVGGIVRITGSDNDQTATRASNIAATSRNYRTFRGFVFDTCTSNNISLATACGNWVIEDCFIFGAGSTILNIAGTGTTNTIRRCIIFGRGFGIQFTHSVVVDTAGHLVENCVLIGPARGIDTARVGGITVKNCTFIRDDLNCVRVSTAITVGQTVTVNNCIFFVCGTVLQGTVAGEIVENYNTFYGNGTDRSNTDTGANSIAYTPLFNPPLLLNDFRFPWFLGELSKWSLVARITGTGEATDDFFGLARPATAAKNSWGAIQATGAARETTTVQGGSVSIKLPDAGEQFLMRVPVTAVSTTISLYCYREADYTGTNPQMILRQPGQSDRTTTDAGAASQWNQLSDVFTPAALPPYVDIFVKSNNTAAATNFDCFFDSVSVS